MGFNFHIGLPGPFSYNARLGGGGRKSGPKPAIAYPVAVFVVAGLLAIIGSGSLAVLITACVIMALSAIAGVLIIATGNAKTRF